MYKALIEIGGYLPGQEVPADLAETWLRMYVEAPVKNYEQGVYEAEQKHKESVKAGSEAIVEKESDNSEAMHDDYLNRNQSVVVKNIKSDNLGNKVLSSLLKIEKADKNRKPVIQAIKHKLRV